MEKDKISTYCKLATVLLIDIIPVGIIIRATTSDGVDSDFLPLGLVVLSIFFLIFTIWALIVYSFTILIRPIWLRDVLFYIFLLLYLFSPIFFL